MAVRRHQFYAAVLAVSLQSGSVLAADAAALLSTMAEKVAGAGQFSVSIHIAYDVVQESGEKIEYSENRKMTLRRPNHLRMDNRQSDGDTGGLIYNGKTLTLFSDTENVYSQIEREGDVAGALRYAVGTLGARVPLARMLLPDFPENIKKISSNVEYVEKNTLGKAPSDHIVGQTSDLDYQFWIGEDGLPRRVVINYRDLPGEPQFRANFSDWNLAPKIDDSDFSYSPPAGAEKIPNILPARTAKPAGEKQGGAS